MSREPNALELEQIALGEVDAASIGVRVDAPEVAARLTALQESTDAIRARYPARTVALRVRERIAARRRRVTLAVAGALAPVAVAALLLVVVRPAEPGPIDDGPDETVIKGQAPDVQVFALKDGAPTRVTEASAGERVQLAIVPAGASHAALVSIDGRGGVTLHFPSAAGASTTIDPRATLRLADSFELDDAPDFERFILVTSDRPIDVDVVLAAARALAADADARRTGALVLPLTVSQTSRTIGKPLRSPR